MVATKSVHSNDAQFNEICMNALKGQDRIMTPICNYICQQNICPRNMITKITFCMYGLFGHEELQHNDPKG